MNRVKAMGSLTVKWTIVFYIYIICLSYFLFFSERYGRIGDNTCYKYNLKLFNEIIRFIRYRKTLGFEIFAVNIFGNILAFAPFGFIVPLINKKHIKACKIIVLSFLFSLTIETIQLIFKVGTFDVDDMLLNTLGGLLGYIVYKILRKKLGESEKKKKECNR